METPQVLKSLGAVYSPLFSFDPGEHKYTYDGREMTGTTTVLKGIKNPDALLGWAANCAVDFLLENPEGHELARTAHLRKRDTRKDEGISTHAQVEKWIKEMIETNEGLPMADTESPIYEFQKNAVFNEWRFLGSEVAVYHLDGFVGGIIDFLFEKDGKVYVGDLKTNKKPRYGSAIYYSYWMQLASYRNALESLGATLSGQCVVRLNSDFEVAYRDNYEQDKGAFLGALEIYRATQDYEKQFKRYGNR